MEVVVAPNPFALVPAQLGEVLAARGFTELTSVQNAVVAVLGEGRDLRISSQTGSGKTVAIGLVLAASWDAEAKKAEASARPAKRSFGNARPDALVLAPTRELAVQIQEELSWLLAPLGVKVGAVTGGREMGPEQRLLRSNPGVLVGTPGRLIDHLERGSLDLSTTRAVVLDEADRMLDMGFRDAIASILEKAPAERRTHLMSATFPAEVLALANAYQSEPIEVRGTRSNVAHGDIRQVIMPVMPSDRLDALINLLLIAPDEKTLVFGRTRADVTQIAISLAAEGLSVAGLSGEMTQRERTATLDAFRKGAVMALVATDVAARGLDVPDVRRVVHYDLPENTEDMTHRSGRTGRAGQKGTSILLVPHRSRRRIESILRAVKVTAAVQQLPTVDDVRKAADERLQTELTGATAPCEERLLALADSLLASGQAREVLARILAQSRHQGACAPRDVRSPVSKEPTALKTGSLSKIGFARKVGQPGWVSFQMSWGTVHEADPRRIMAVVCRRGDVSSQDVGAIEVGERSSRVEIAVARADEFELAVKRPDISGEPIRFRRWCPEQAGAMAKKPAKPGRRGSSGKCDLTRAPERRAKPQFARR